MGNQTMTNSYFISKWNSLTEMDDRLTLLKRTMLTFHRNKELIGFLDVFIKSVSDQCERKLTLLFAKKTINQFPRALPEDYIKAFEEELNLNSDVFCEEQRMYDPNNWIDCELDFIEQKTQLNLNEVPLNKIHSSEKTLEKELLTKEDALVLLKISKATLDRWRWEGMPCFKEGRKIYFRKTEIVNWLNRKK